MSKTITAEHIVDVLERYKSAESVYTVIVEFNVEAKTEHEYPMGSKGYFESKITYHSNVLVATTDPAFSMELKRKLETMSNVQLFKLAISLGWIYNDELSESTAQMAMEKAHPAWLFYDFKRKLIRPNIHVQAQSLYIVR